MPSQKDAILGRLAVERGYLTRNQVDEAFGIQRKMHGELGLDQPLVEVLIGKHWLTADQTHELRKAAAVETGEARLVAGYEAISKLGQGGMGAVYKARHVGTSDLVALKILPPSLADKQMIARFRRESEIVRKLHHRNIVGCIEFGFDKRRKVHFCALELVEGEDLGKYLRRKGRLSEDEAVSIAQQIAAALQHAYYNALVHRDVKPENIMVTADGTAKLLDLGLARPADQEATRLTESGMFVGSPYYASPEQAVGEKEVDTRSDIYSLGATLYHMVTGKPPFEGTTALAILRKHVTEKLPWPAEVNPELSDGLCRIIAKMMEKAPEDRYQTPNDLHRDLDLLVEGEEPEVHEAALKNSSVKVPAVRPKRRRRLPGRSPGQSAAIVPEHGRERARAARERDRKHRKPAEREKREARAGRKKREPVRKRRKEAGHEAPKEPSPPVPQAAKEDVPTSAKAGKRDEKAGAGKPDEKPPLRGTYRARERSRKKALLTRRQKAFVAGGAGVGVLLVAGLVLLFTLREPEYSWTEGAVLALPFDDDTIYGKDGKTWARDLGGHENDGAVTGAKPATGTLAGALEFGGGNDHVEVPNSRSLEGVQEGDYSICAWVSPDTVPPGTGSANDRSYAVLAKTGSHMGLRYDNSGKFAMQHWTARRGSATASTTGIQDPRSFYHVTGVVSKVRGATDLYVNGKLESTAAFPRGAVAREYGREPWRIGIAWPGATSHRWAMDGKIDDVAIWNRALSAEEVKGLHEYSKAGRSYCRAIGRAAGRRRARERAARRKLGLPSTWHEGAVLALPFDKDTIYKKAGKTWAKDMGGRENNGHVVGAKLATGQAGGALVFDGKDDCVVLPSLRDRLVRLEAITLSVWAKKTGKGGAIFDVGSASDTSLSIHYGGFNLPGGGAKGFNVNSPPAGEGWHSIVGVWDGKDQRLFVDGVPKATSPRTGDLLSRLGKQVARIGCQAKELHRKERHFGGLIDEVAIWYRALSAEEVKSLYEYSEQGKSYCRAIGRWVEWKREDKRKREAEKLKAIRKKLHGPGSRLVGHWKFDDGKGTTARDSSGNDYHGTLSGTPTWEAGFLGTGSVGCRTGYIELPDIQSEFTNEATLSVWIKMDSAAGSSAWNGIFHFGTESNTHYVYTDNSFYVNAFRNNRRSFVPPATPDRATWHHMAITSAPGVGKWKVYLNATEVYSTNGLTRIYLPTNCRIGHGANLYAGGNLDDVRIYNRALSAAEVKALATSK